MNKGANARNAHKLPDIKRFEEPLYALQKTHAFTLYNRKIFFCLPQPQSHR